MTPPVRSLDRFAVAAMLILCVDWGFNQVIVKLALAEVGPIAQGGLRAAIGFIVVALYAVVARPAVFRRDGTERAGLVAGLLFTIEFILLFLSLRETTAARAGVFVYTAPFFVALGATLFLPSEKPRPLQWAGLALAFAGVAFGLYRPGVGASQLGDGLAIAAALSWGATTMVIKTTTLRRADPGKVLLYQIGAAAVVSPFAAWFAGEAWPTHLSTATLVNLAYQGVFVVGMTFLFWFWLLARYSAAELSAFTFLTPVVGVFAGWLVLGEALTPSFVVALVLVAAGLAVINWPQRRAASPAVRRDPA